MLWEGLRKRRIGETRFRRQFSVGAYVLDFYCPELRFAIEVDWGIHGRDDIRKKDTIRQTAIENLKITVMRISNSDIVKDPAGTIKRIAYVIAERRIVLNCKAT